MQIKRSTNTQKYNKTLSCRSHGRAALHVVGNFAEPIKVIRNYAVELVCNFNRPINQSINQ